MDFSKFYPKNMLQENEEMEKNHILQSLADKDINAKVVGKKSFVVHKDNVTKAKAHLKKLGMHNDYVITHDPSMNEGEEIEESSVASADYKISKDGRKYPASRISFKDYNKKQDEDLKESVATKYEYSSDGKHIAHVSTKDKDGNTEQHSYSANDKETLQKHIKKSHGALMKGEKDLGSFKQKSEHEFIEDNTTKASKGTVAKTIGGLKLRTVTK